LFLFCFRDVKCILELDFAFTIHAVSLCEEFLVCASATECQLIQLNFSAVVCVDGDSKDKESSQSAHLAESLASSDQTAAEFRSKCCPYADVNTFDSSWTTDGTTVDHVVGIGCAVGSSPNDADLGIPDIRERRHDRTGLRQAFTHSDLSMSQTSHECDELFAGPVKGSRALCPVSVEFEGIVFTFSWNHMSYFFTLYRPRFDIMVTLMSHW